MVIKRKMKLRRNWQLGFFGFFALFAIPMIKTGGWINASWLVWLIWFIFFIPIKENRK